MLRGSCLCGGVRYEISGKLNDALNCHCSMWGRAEGAASGHATAPPSSVMNARLSDVHTATR